MTVPALRRDDVTREVDLIEEVARIDGLERLPATLPARRGAAGRLSHAQRVRRAAEDALVGRGLYEIVGWSFTDPGLLDRLRLPAGHPLRSVVRLENPLSEDQSIMRPTLLGSLLDAARHNVARNGPDIAIFESGTVYRAPRGRRRLADEHHALGVLLSGALRAAPPGAASAPRRTSSPPRRCWRRCSSKLPRALVGASRRAGRSCIPAAAPPCSPAARSERVGSACWASCTRWSPREWDLGRTAVFAIDLGRLAAAAPPVAAFRAFARSRRCARTSPWSLPEEVAARAGCSSACARRAGRCSTRWACSTSTPASRSGEGRRSLALALSFRSAERTLTDEDVAPVRARIVAALGELGGELRG